MNIGGREVVFGNFDAYDWVSAYGDGYNIDGNLWAPDIIYNETMKKWCMYMSLNGPNHNSVIVLLTADKIDGTYIYQGPAPDSSVYGILQARMLEWVAIPFS